jgi:nitrogen fixation/metabolism regulation signal transduction histidine kinase
MSRLGLERKVQLLALLAGLPGTALGLALLWASPLGRHLQWGLTILVVALWLVFVRATRRAIAFPLRTVSNLLGALREGDSSIRASGAAERDSFGEVLRELNALASGLGEARRGAAEAAALARRVLEETGVAVFAFDGQARLCLVNRAGERLLGRPAERLLGEPAPELGLAECLEGDASRIVEMTFPHASGRWEIRRSRFREGGLPHDLLVISDLSRALREEERQAWKRLIRVLGHELNNSLAPLMAVADSLSSLLKRRELPDDWREDTRSGLDLIASRAGSLARFMESYARLARLPPPTLQPMDVEQWVRRSISLESRLAVRVLPGPAATISGDPGQLEQLLINLIRNAVDAAAETGGAVQVGWRTNGNCLEVIVEDEGPGLPPSANLFVPFFTTKPGGSGIGLILSREIAEAHGGSLALANREGKSGCHALLCLPL